MPRSNAPHGPSILYVASRLPELSETFVYRELLGLRSRGRRVLGASVRPPRRLVDDPALARLADEVTVIYTPATFAVLPLAIAHAPRIAFAAIRDAFAIAHPSLKSRAKHLVQAMAGLGIAWRLRGEGIGHVHAHMANVPAMIALYIARGLGARFSFTGHAADLFVQGAAVDFKLHDAAFVACISHWHRDYYADILPLADDRRPLVRCSVAIPAAVREAGRDIVTVARLVPKKGIDLLIRAFHSAALEGWRLRILGDGPERMALENLTAELGLGNRVIFEGAQPHAVCLDAIAGAGMFVLPCRTAANGDKDGIPVVLMEAMAAGRAVIAGDLPTIRELVDDRESGLLVAPDDSEALAQSIRKLAADPDAMAKLGTAARDKVTAEFSDDVNLDRLTAAFDRAGTAA